MKTRVKVSMVELHDAFPCISVSTLDELVRRNLLHIDGNEWRFGDESNGTTRRFNNSKWKSADNSGNEWHKLIGLGDVVRNDHREVFFLIEGSKDALAAAEIANRSGTLSQTGIICALGSGYRPIRAELEQLRGRWVGVIGDNDAPGIETTQIVSSELSAAGVDHAIWNWLPCQTNSKDLFSWLASSPKTNFAPLICNFFAPLSFPQFNRSTVQPFTRSTTQISDLSTEEKLGIIYSFYRHETRHRQFHVLSTGSRN